MALMNIPLRRTLIAAIAGFIAGGLTVMLLARESSSVYLKNSLALVPAYLSFEVRDRIADQDFVEAERLIASQSGVRWYYSKHPAADAKWTLTYPLTAWFVDKATSGMASTPTAIDREWKRSNAMLDAQLALVMEMQGNLARSRELMEMASSSSGSDEDALRKAAREALGM